MALPEGMNYTQHIDSLGIKKDRIALAPNNGSSFQSGTSAPQFEVPCMQLTKFADFSNAYVSFDLNNGDATSIDLQGNLGTMALMQKITVETTSNKKFSELDNANNLLDIKLSQSVEPDWYDTNGQAMFGTSSDFFDGGLTIAAGGSAHLIMPVSLTGLADGTYIPLFGRENIRFKIDLEQATTAVIASAAGIVNSELTIDNVQFHYDVMTLSDDQMKNLLNHTGGKFIVKVHDYYHQNAQIAAGDTAANISIGCSRSQATKLIVCARTLTQMTDDSLNSFSRNKANITQVTVRHNGLKVGGSDLTVDPTTAPEVLAEILKCNHGSILSLNGSSLCRYGTDTFNIDDPASNSNATVGRFVAEIDLTAGLETPYTVGGLNCMTGNFNLELVKGATGGDIYLDIYVEYNSEYVIDMKGGNTWQVYN